MPRATTAAWEVMPPRTVRMPWEAAMPSMSSGEVSRRTRTTFSPRSAHSLASSAVKTTWPQAAPGEAARPVPIGLGGLQGGGVKLGMEQGVQLLGLHAQNGLLLGDHALVHQVHGDLQGGGGGALAVAGLEHVELAVFNGELHVLHVPVVVFQLVGDVGKLLVHLGHVLLELVDGLGGADAGHHVLALGVDEVLAEELLLTGGGVAGEGHAGAGIVVQVAEDHGLHVDSSAPGIGDVVHAAVDSWRGDCPRSGRRP